MYRIAVPEYCDETIVTALHSAGSVHRISQSLDVDSDAYDALILDWRQQDVDQAVTRLKKLDHLPLIAVIGPDQYLSDQVCRCETVEFAILQDLESTAFRCRLQRMIQRNATPLSVNMPQMPMTRLLYQVVDCLRDWVIIKDLDHRFLMVSDDFARTVCLPRSDIIGRNDLEIGTEPQAVLGNPDTGQTGFWAQDDAVIASGEASSEENRDWRAFAVERRYKRTVRVPLRNAQGAIYALLVVVSDITDRVVAERNLKSRNLMLRRVTEAKLNAEQHRQVAETAIAAKNKFLASASHDLRQPLHALGLFLAVLERRVHDDDNLEIVQKIRHSSDTLNSLFNSLLDMSRLDAGIVEVSLQTFCIRELLISIRDEFVQLGEARELTVSVEVSDVTVHTDPVLFGRILRNLLQNAITHTQEGEVRVCCREEAGQLIIDVIDTGPGIPENQHEAIFSEYYQLDASLRQSTGGMGLGLAIVRKMAQLLQTGIRLQSVLGKGSTFSVNVPLGENGVAQPANKPLRERNLSGTRILFIDDEPHIRDALTLILDGYQCQVISAESPVKAIESLTARAMEPDIMIIDYRLKNEQTGVVAIEMLRNHFDRPIPAIIVTGDTSKVILQAVRKTGCRLLHKPLDARELVQAITEVMKAEELILN
ncbi:ATP-binding response regulator [Granulosicoccus sp. 3-233]|uniref:ATP-binding response regulator n=1 Tax=Granulosicoccus sp. 3-233 TaxID=3417969 RepID=UPI003D343A63